MHPVPHILILTAVSSGIGYLMIVAGLQKNALERRRQERLCASCGRIIETRVCSVCTSP
jgi:multisubunit Na+/H+ antiporter MnhC subunit